MDFNKLSDYDRYILMASKSGKIPMTATGFNAYKELKTILELCSKSDTSTLDFKGKIFKKPMERNEAIRLLEDCNNMKWNPKLRQISKHFGLEFK